MSLPLPHGREISSEELEMIAGREFPLKRFVSLCNSLVWATSKSKELTQASLTERVLVKDNGVDAEWTINLGDNARHGALLGQGWNVFQYKQRDISGSDRQHIVANLRAGLRGAAREVHARTQRRPDHYSLFTNIDLNHQEKQGLEAAIRNEFEDPLHVTIRGAADLAAALNDLPHLRSAFFSTARFSTWEHAWLAHSKASVIGSVPDLVGRNSDVEEIRVALEDDNIRVLAITGPSGIGKNRVSLEATAHRPLDTVIVLDAALGVADLLQIKRPGQNPVVIIDNPDEEQTDELIGAALGEDLKLVFTITDPTAAQQFNFAEIRG